MSLPLVSMVWRSTLLSLKIDIPSTHWLLHITWAWGWVAQFRFDKSVTTSSSQG